MTRPLRRAHRILAFAMAVLLPLLIAIALCAGPEPITIGNGPEWLQSAVE